MKKQNIIPIVVLTVICVVVAILLALTNLITEPTIKDAESAEIKKSLSAVMPDGNFDYESDELKSDAPETVRAVYTDKNGGGHVVVLITNKGYTGKEIGITVAIGTDGKIINSQLTKNEESIVPSDMKPGGTYGEAYKGADGSSVLDVVTGATVKYSEAAIKNALYDAFVYLGYAEKSETEEPEETPDAEEKLPRSDEELLDMAKELVPEADKFENVTRSEMTYVKRLYRANTGEYVAYLNTIASYGGTLETETMLVINEDAEILAVRKLLWIVGHSMFYGPPPPTDEAVDEYFQSFVGVDHADVKFVDVITHATGTSDNVRFSVIEALNTVYELETTSVGYRVIGIIAFSVVVLGIAAIIIFEKRRNVK